MKIIINDSEILFKTITRHSDEIKSLNIFEFKEAVILKVFEKIEGDLKHLQIESIL